MNAATRGTVYGTLMNFEAEVTALGPRLHEAPYQAPPRAPVLYVKPANTWSESDAAIPVPAHVAEVGIGATVAIVIGAAGEAACYVLLNDLTIPHESFFRPPVKFNGLDGFLGIGAQVCRADALGDPAAIELEVRINGELRQTVRFAHLVRPAERLLADVTTFMTLGPGDLLMLGCDADRPRARVGDRIDISAPLLGTLTNTLVAEAA